ncbi:MAG: GNAT family N-acetyltransferase [Campylobacteraceae bacterium]|nr:GNAT family N-acetyltransferase [Campylobacteraceae bacterium]
MRISVATKNDIKKLYEIESTVFKDDIFALKFHCFYYHIKNSIVYKVKIGEVVGYILWLKRKSFFRLYSLAILDKYQGLGLASSLIKYSLKNLEKKSLQLEVRVSNKKARILYKKFGFEEVKILKKYYKNEDGVLMRLER